MSTVEKDQGAAPPYESPRPQHTNTLPLDPNTRGTSSPGPQMVMVPNVAPPQQPATTPLNLLREQPGYVFCPQVGKVCQTRAESKDSDKTWFAVIGICLICPCVACFPLKGCCGDGMLQDWDHYCTGCGSHLIHRPYNHDNQLLRPDHDSANPANPMGWQNAPQQMQYAQPQYAQPQYAQPQYAQRQ